MRTSTIILSKNIRIDKDYINVLSYNVEQMLNLLKSSNNLVKMISNCSFLRDRNYFTIEIDYNSALKVNYLAFTNPDYSNKWFFAFVDKIEYVNNKAVNIYYTIDHWTTWFDDWQPAKAYVIREHPNSIDQGDSRSNTIPEDIYYGEDYIVNDSEEVLFWDDLCIIAGYTMDPKALSEGNVEYVSGTYSGLPSGCAYYYYHLNQAGIGHLQEDLNIFSKHGDPNAIVGIAIACDNLTSILKDGQRVPDTYGDPTQQVTNLKGILKLDGYEPVNKKLLTYPYCFYRIHNSAGGCIILKQELFDNGPAGILITEGVLSLSSSVILYPRDYAGAFKSFENVLSLGKYPQLSYQTNNYDVWLRQNALNQASALINGGMNIATGAASLAAGSFTGAGNLINGSLQIAQSVNNMNIARTMAPSFYSATNINDVITAMKELDFKIEYVTIKREYAELIDDYLSRYGYKTLRYKIPNISTRSTFNYLQISNDSVIGVGDVPAESMSIINNVARRGVTIYQNHSLI